MKYYTENYDYSITTVSNREDIIMITPDCFKSLCMMSQTPKAKEVRQYFLSVEKLIRKYHIYIEEKLRDKIKLLETNQKPKCDNKSGIIYFFKALNQIEPEDEEEFLYKLGKTISKNNRFNTYNSGNANDIEPLFILECTDIDKVEKCIKNLLTDHQYRKYKEIYKIDKDALKTIIIKCDELVRGLKKYINSNNKDTNKANFKKLRDSKNDIILSFEKNNSC